MQDKQIAAKYDPSELEQRWFTRWQDAGHFKLNEDAPGSVYTVVIPPPNITGSLHVGHALNNSIQDILIRFKRMAGFKVLWQPGTDHAGIATQNKVEQSLAKEGKTRHDLGREDFIKKCWEWRDHFGRDIVEQLKLLGCSCDWERERFTMDEGLSRAVRQAFKKYYDDGLIYRGARMVNWCPRCHTSISDLEVKHEERNGSLWYIDYPLADGSGKLTVATTRPETMLGDTGVAVHPDDKRYKGFIGKMIALPLTDREIPIVADEHVDPEFGTGVVKVTPAHDFNDAEIGLRNKLPSLIVINYKGEMTEDAGAAYAGLTREECRKKVIADLEESGRLSKTEDYAISAATCDRCHAVIEPLVSEQWWLDVEKIKQPAIEVVKNEKVRFFPERWTRIYLDWMENLQPWCISRQLWWGHQIPVWYCDACDETIVEAETPTACPKCGGKLRQEEDVLDTWFSSALWPLSTLGWPDNEEELAKLYPTAVLSTAPDIIYLWVARMIMSGMYFRDKEPFHSVYLHATILAQDGRRMSKSLGTGVDPREIISEYGTDALRFTIVSLTGQGQSVKLWNDRFTVGRNFANKLWNAARFLRLNVAETELEETAPLSAETLPDADETQLEDRWIISRLGRLGRDVTEALESYRFNEAARSIYDAFWHDYCDWYLELIKPRLYSDDPAKKQRALSVALHGMRLVLKLLHPIMPFITEELYHHLFPNATEDLIVSQWEDGEDWPSYLFCEEMVGKLQELIEAVRNVRGEMNVPPGARISLLIKTEDSELAGVIEKHQHYFANLTRVEELTVGADLIKPDGAAATVVGETVLYLPLKGVIDFAAEAERVKKELGKLRGHLTGTEKKLANESFVSRAPAEVVEHEREKCNRLASEIEALEKHLEQIEKMI